MDWNGTGLPPIGTDCEIYWAAGEYVPVRIVGHDEDRAVFRLCQDLQRGTYGAASAGELTFRPRRTAEQLAVEQALEEIEQLYAEGGPSAVYDAGYRKT